MINSIPLIFPDTADPIRAELFSVERLEQHAESLAAAQAIKLEPAQGRPLLPRVLENGRVLLEYYRATARAIQQEKTITPAGEWLVDNFYIVEEQLREIRDDLPQGYGIENSPKLASGHLQGYPRVFGVAWAFVAHTDSRFEPDLLQRFVNAYQRLQPLTSGELWAVAITLRVVLVENLRRLAESIGRSHRAREEADILADSLLSTAGQPPIDPATALRHFENKPLDRAVCVVQSGPASARFGSEGRPDTDLVGRSPRCAGNHGRRNRARGAPGPDGHDRYGSQRHYEHAADLGGGLA